MWIAFVIVVAFWVADKIWTYTFNRDLEKLINEQQRRAASRKQPKV